MNHQSTLNQSNILPQSMSSLEVDAIFPHHRDPILPLVMARWSSNPLEPSRTPTRARLSAFAQGHGAPLVESLTADSGSHHAHTPIRQHAHTQIPPTPTSDFQLSLNPI